MKTSIQKLDGSHGVPGVKSRKTVVKFRKRFYTSTREFASDILYLAREIPWLNSGSLNRAILTEENSEDVVRLTNEELSQTCDDERDKIDILSAEIAEVDSRLGKLYDALETEEFKGGELAPRIKALFEEKEQLQQAKVKTEEALEYQTI